MTVVHTGADLAATSHEVAFAIENPQITLEVEVADPQLQPGQPLEATLTVSNTDPDSPSGELALLALTNTGDSVATWSFELDPSQATERQWRFVPQQAGPGILHVAMLADAVLVTADRAYMVGEGAAVSLNVAVAATHAPGGDVPLTLTATNAGTEPTSALVSVTTVEHYTRQEVGQ